MNIQLTEAIALLEGARAKFIQSEFGTGVPVNEVASVYEDLGAALNRLQEYQEWQAKSDPFRSDGLREWWMDLAASEVDPMIAKMNEYGGSGRAIDLIDIGRSMLESGVRPWHPDRNATDAELIELGIYFYEVGKFARWRAAIIEGRPVSNDTLHDLGIYIRMLQRVRAVGGWPV